jgi:serine/threonine protein kinase
MPLTAGTRLGPYEIESPIGAGGMGEVYRARDTRLNRTVAIKVMRDWAGTDAAQRDRFKREAEIVASLDHPNICALHDVGRDGDVDYFVMPFLTGETLAARLARGPIPVGEALTIATAIADALDRAHHRGIVHRDLKPGNVMLTATGPRLLDFGLARHDSAPATDAANTATRPVLTVHGQVMGTLPYMAPEQLTGGGTDARTDVWAFGCLLYEMLAGRPAFPGPSETDVMRQILADEPAAIERSGVSAPLQAIVSGALVKHADERWQSLRDVKRTLAIAAAPSSALTAVHAGPRFSHAALASVGLLTLSTLAFAVLWWRSGSTTSIARPVTQFDLDAPAGASIPIGTDIDLYFAVSPDGRHVAFLARGTPGILIKSVDATAPVVLPNTQGASTLFWSPDSTALAFVVKNELRRTTLSGGTSQLICAVDGPNINGTWSAQGTILLAEWSTRKLRHVPAKGGVPTILFEGEQSRLRGWPVFLPDGRHFIYREMALGISAPKVFVGSLDGGEPVEIPGVSSRVEYADGHLFFSLEGALRAQRFDLATFRLLGEPAVVAERVTGFASTGYAAFSVSPDVVVYQQPRSIRELVWTDRQGAELGIVGEKAIFTAARLSDDGSRIAYAAVDLRYGTNDIFALDVDRGVPTQITREPAADNGPIWKPDGSALAFASDRRGPPHIHIRSANGTGDTREIVPPSLLPQGANAFTPDGHSLLFMEAHPKTGRDLMLVPVDGSAAPVAIVQTTANEDGGRISRDGRWLAYVSDESGRSEVYVQALRDSTTRRRVSNNGGTSPRWRRDSAELFYVGGPQRANVMVVPMTIGASSLDPGPPQPLFPTRRIAPVDFDVKGDGQRFLLIVPDPILERGTLSAILNWSEMVARR